MKHLRDNDEDAPDYSLHQKKRLKDAHLPRSIRSLPHVMKRIDLFAMTIPEAAVEAAANNDIERLEALLDQMDVNSYRDDVGCSGTDIAAGKGYTEVIKTIYRWWVSGGYEPMEMCMRALAKAAAAGHDQAARALLSNWYLRELNDAYADEEEYDVEQVYDFDVLEALELALKHDHYKAARVICEKSKIPGELYKWAAEHDDAQVFDDVYYYHGDRDMDNLYRALLIAVSRGCVGIVKTALGRRGAELLDYVDGDDSSPCPLVTAIKHGQREVVDFLYAHDTGCEDDSYVPAFCTAAAYGPLELVKMFYDNETFEGPVLDNAFASAAGRSQLETMTYLRSKREFDGKAIDAAFVEAASNGQLEAAKYLENIEGHRVSTASLDKSFEGAACGCHLGMLQFLDGVATSDSCKHYSGDMRPARATDTHTRGKASTTHAHFNPAERTGNECDHDLQLATTTSQDHYRGDQGDSPTCSSSSQLQFVLILTFTC